MRSLWIAIVSALLLSGCSVSPIHLSDRVPESYRLPIGKLVIDNLASEAKISVSDTVYVNGWAPLHSGFKPQLHESMVSKLRNAMVADSQSGRVDVAVLRVGLWVEKSVVDDVVFIGFLTLGAERGYKCDVDVNIKSANDSRRMTLEHQIRRSYFDSNEEVRQFVESCQSDLVRQLAEAIRSAS